MGSRFELSPARHLPATFEGERYIHRDASLGDFIAMQLYEDPYRVGKSALLRVVAQIAQSLSDGIKRHLAYTKFF